MTVIRCNKDSFSFITRFMLIMMACMVCVLSSGCFSKSPERTYFSIDYTLGTQPKQQTPKYDKTVVLQSFTTALAYDRQEIVYRSNPYEFQYYWYRLWASKPKKMLNELILGHLRYTNLFKNVSGRVEERIPDYQLGVDIQAIEELDVSDTEWYAHLNLEFTLTRQSDKAVVWTYAFDARRSVADNKPVYVVKAMSELLDTELVKAFQDLDNHMANMHEVESVNPPKTAIDYADSSDSSDAMDENSAPAVVDSPRAVLKNKP